MIWSLPTRSSSGRRVGEDRWCRSPQLGFYNLPTARIFSLEQSLEQSSDSPSDSPSNRRSNVRSLYRVAHIRCHLSGRASPSRTISYRRLDSLAAVWNYFVEGEKERRIIAMPCGEKLEMSWRALSTSIYSVGKGWREAWGWRTKGGAPSTKQPTKGGRKLHGGAPHLPATHGGAPSWGAPPPPNHAPWFVGGCLPPWGPPNIHSTKWGLPPKGVAPLKTAHESWDLVPLPGTSCFSRPFSPKKFRKVPEHFRHPPKSSKNACRNLFGLMVYSETIFRSLRNFSGFLSETFSVSPKLFRWLSLRLPV